MYKFWREPLIQFLVAGVLLYGLAAWWRGPALWPEDERLISVDREALLNFMQFRANAFDAESFSRLLDELTDAELQQLANDYVDEEILFREARALGLDQSDYIIRQRMVEKIQFLLADIAGAQLQPTDAELQAYLEANAAAYQQPPAYTFTHVYFDASRQAPEALQELAAEALESLNTEQAGFNDANGLGDRFPFLRNYVERTAPYVASHFGQDFAAQLARLPVLPEQWQGPLESEYGLHLVLLRQASAARAPSLAEVRYELSQDYLTERRQELLQQATARLREQYRIELNNLRTAP